jgi:hypothetical protein
VARESDYLALFRDCPPGSIAGEASSTYLASPAAPANLARHVPRARLVAILRHPVERAYSQWLHQLQEGYEPLDDFEAAWADEDRRIESGWRPLYAYRGRGFYGQHLERWLGFFPREQLLVLFYEDWQRDPAGTLALVWKHLGVAPVPVPTITRENVSSRQPRWKWLHHRMVENNAVRRWAQRFLPLSVRDAITRSVTGVNLGPGPKLDPAVRARLAPVFHEDLGRVSRLTGRDLASWK